MSDSMSGSGSEQNQNPVQDHYVRQIDLAASSSKSAFCCAGRVPIAQQSAFEKIKEDVKDYQLTSHPVVICWDHKDSKSISKLTLPPKSYEGDAEDQIALRCLLENSAPAVFGNDGKDVLDESYRKAAKLDSDRFLTNFNPYEVGIIGAIVQTLLPGVAGPLSGGKRTFIEDMGVVAELYKLNVRVASLVVCIVLC